MQREIPEEVNIKGSKIAREMGVKVILDVGGEEKPLSNDLLGLLDIISPNETELRRITNKTIDIHSDEEIVECLKHMREISNNPKLTMLLKLGSKGCAYIDENNKVTRQKALHCHTMPIVDTTGAGDTLTGSFATQYLENKPIEDCLQFSSAAAYICITKFASMPSMPTIEELSEFLNKIKI